MNEHALLQILIQADYESLALAVGRYAKVMSEFSKKIEGDRYGADISAKNCAKAANSLAIQLMDLHIVWDK